ncbi:MAG: SPOR domain-containing protein [Bacteroidota bacterium]|nr:SPOR domain-containing protein [Bacteroidota bacterium]
MTRSLLLLVSIIFSVCTLMAQGNRSVNQGDLLLSLQEGGSGDRVTIEVDSLMLANYNKLITKNMKSSGILGYRIRIYSESGLGAKKEQQQVRARFLSLYPGLDAYNRYDEPFFKVYVGDCRTKSDALKLQDKIRKAFPNSIIREDYINLKSTD